MRVLILTPEYLGSGGGIMTFYRSLVPALRRNGVEVRVIEGSPYNSTPDPRAARGENAGAHAVLERSRLDGWWTRFAALEALPGLRRHLAASWAMWEQAEYGAGADIVEACDWGLSFIPPLADATKPLIVQCHGSLGQIAHHDPLSGEEVQDKMLRLIERAAFASANLQVSSSANAAFWAKEAGAAPEIIRPAWDFQAGAAGAVAPRGLVAGRVQRWKGPQILCEALRLLGPRTPEIDWFGRDVAWGDQETSSSSYLARTYPDIWGKKVIHHPPVATAEVERRQAGALFNLVPSTWDIFNFTAVEAMASGRPTIVSSGAAASELIEDGINGFLFPSGDATGLAGTIERVTGETPAKLADIGKRAQATVRAELDPDKIAAERIEAYRKAIAAFERDPPQRIEGWLGDAVRPSLAAPESLAFLDQQPLRPILTYAARRLARRLGLK